MCEKRQALTEIDEATDLILKVFRSQTSASTQKIQIITVTICGL